MLQTAAEIQSQMSDIKEEVRKKKLLLQFNLCATCKVDIEFKHQVQVHSETESVSEIVEWGHCPCCQGKIAPRRYRIH